ncbi:hypothetical protein ACP70R_029632 [Stipagrostis hirtigluma subsp. patula]
MHGGRAIFMLIMPEWSDNAPQDEGGTTGVAWVTQGGTPL